MKIVCAVKVVPDDQDVVVAADRSLDYSKAHQIISTYDLNAIEAAAQTAEANGASVVAISASKKAADDMKVKKSILSRGIDELFMVADDAMGDAESRPTAKVLQGLLGQVGEYDLILCGDGSADNYAGQVDVQLASLLGIPVVNGVTALRIEDGKAIVERTFDTEIEEVEVSLPAVVSVSPDIAVPRIAGMREILAAGKKPASIQTLDELGVSIESSFAIEEVKAPELADRKNEIFDMSKDGDFDSFVAAVAEALR